VESFTQKVSSHWNLTWISLAVILGSFSPIHAIPQGPQKHIRPQRVKMMSDIMKPYLIQAPVMESLSIIQSVFKYPVSLGKTTHYGDKCCLFEP